MLLTTKPSTNPVPPDPVVEKDEYPCLVCDLRAQLATWLQSGNSHLTGVYLEFDMRMVGEWADVVRDLCSKYKIGVWGISPDCLRIMEQLVKLGVSFVNTDYPRNFLIEDHQEEPLPATIPRSAEQDTSPEPLLIVRPNLPPTSPSRPASLKDKLAELRGAH